MLTTFRLSAVNLLTNPRVLFYGMIALSAILLLSGCSTSETGAL